MLPLSRSNGAAGPDQRHTVGPRSAAMDGRHSDWAEVPTARSRSGFAGRRELMSEPQDAASESMSDEGENLAAECGDLVDELAEAAGRDAQLEMGDTHLAQRSQRRRHLLGAAR